MKRKGWIWIGVMMLVAVGAVVVFRSSGLITGKRIPHTENQIALISENDLYVWDVETQEIVQLTQGHQIYHAIWAPDGEHILVATAAHGLFYVLTPSSGELLQINIPKPAGQAAWSPDGGQIAFYSDGNIYVVNRNGTALKQLAEGSSPAWSPDGSQILFVEWNPQEENQTVSEFRTIHADGSGLRTLFTFPGEADRPAWSPSGEQILFLEFIPKDENSSGVRRGKLYLVDADGNNIHLLDIPNNNPGSPPLTWQNVHPVWSPDGKEIIFEDHSLTVFRYSIETGEFLRIGVGEHPVWNSTGDQIAFMKTLGERSLCVVSRDLFSRTDFDENDISCADPGVLGKLAGWRP